MTAFLATFAALTAATTLALSVAFGWRVRLQHLDSDSTGRPDMPQNDPYAPICGPNSTSRDSQGGDDETRRA